MSLDVNETCGAYPGAILRRERLDPEDRIIEDPFGEAASKNYGPVHRSAMLLNTINGHPSLYSLDQQHEWWSALFAHPFVMRSETQSTTYNHHHFDSMLVARACFGVLAARDARFAKLEADAGEWLRHFAAYLAVNSVPWQGRDLSRADHGRPGPGVWTATAGPTSRQQQADHWVAHAGARSLENYNLRGKGESPWLMVGTVAHILLSVCLGNLGRHEIAKALQTKGWWKPVAEGADLDLLRRCVADHRDVEDRRAVLGWLGRWDSDAPMETVVTSEGVVNVMRRNMSGSTASVDLSASTSDRCWWAAGSMGYRRSDGLSARENPAACETVIDTVSRTATIKRLDGLLPVVVAPIPGGEVLLHFRYGDGKGVEYLVGGPPKPVEPPVGDSPSPTDQDSRKVREKNNRTFEYVIGGIALAVILYALLF